MALPNTVRNTHVDHAISLLRILQKRSATAAAFADRVKWVACQGNGQGRGAVVVVVEGDERPRGGRCGVQGSRGLDFWGRL